MDLDSKESVSIIETKCDNGFKNLTAELTEDGKLIIFDISYDENSKESVINKWVMKDQYCKFWGFVDIIRAY